MARLLVVLCALSGAAQAERLVFEAGVSGGLTMARADRSVGVSATVEAGASRGFGPVVLAFGARVGVETLGAVLEAATLAPVIALRFRQPNWFPYLLASAVAVLDTQDRELDFQGTFGVEGRPGWFVELGYRHRIAGDAPVPLSGLVASLGVRVGL